MAEMNTDLPGLFDVYRMLGWAFGPSVLAFAVLFFRHMRRKRRGIVLPSDKIKRTGKAAFGGHIPSELNLLASSGTGVPAHNTLGELFLKPSWGLRLIAFGLPVAGYFILGHVYSQPRIVASSFDVWAIAITFGLMIYAAFYIGTYELRYDDFRFAHRDWRFVKREVRWDDLMFIRDGGAYYFALHGAKSGKIYVPQYLTGIEDFIGLAQSKIAENAAK